GKGTGLGLSTVYGIVKQNRGFINVLSEPGKGTVVKIYLPPHSEKEEETVEVIQEEIPYGRGETILVVEDEASILRLAGTILERLGYNVLATEHAGDALKIAREHGDEIHLLIIDVVLPEMNGKDLAEAIMRIRPNIRVLFMSGYSSDIIGRHGVLNEGVHFLQKPFSLNMMARKVGEMLNR
ncbi:MAG: response regulator, partial [Deltaproteobacteria bacterium]|nr:response regulator [Deltaproteobacteria bacterium]